jgi:Flp pilus assembly pilin Flp
MLSRLYFLRLKRAAISGGARSCAWGGSIQGPSVLLPKRPTGRRALLARALNAESGMTAVEFALLAPTMLLLLFGIVEFCLVMMVTNMMENATNLSSRLGKTGFSEAGLSREATIRAAVVERLGDLIEPEHLTIDAKFYNQFDQIDQGEPWNDANGNGVPETGEYTDINGNGSYDSDLGSAGYGGAEDIVVYRVEYPWPIITPIMREFLGNANGDFVVSAHAVVRNEPYDD